VKRRDHTTDIKGIKDTQKYVIKSYGKRSHGKITCSWEMHANITFILRECNGVPYVRI
jgi:hypothetical protein